MLKRMIAAPTRTMVSVWPTPRNSPNQGGFGERALAAHNRRDRNHVVGISGMAHAEKKSQNEDGKSGNHRQPATSHAAVAAGTTQNSRERPAKRAFLASKSI